MQSTVDWIAPLYRAGAARSFYLHRQWNPNDPNSLFGELARKVAAAGQVRPLKNIKLRMSRKLLFVKGLLMCFCCEGAAPEGTDINDGEAVLRGIASKCYELARLSPIDLLCRALLDHSEAETARTVVSCYNRFLEVLDSKEQRTELQKLDAEGAVDNDLFISPREMSHRYSGGLEEMFFDSDFLRPLTRMYGVF